MWKWRRWVGCQRALAHQPIYPGLHRRDVARTSTPSAGFYVAAIVTPAASLAATSRGLNGAPYEQPQLALLQPVKARLRRDQAQWRRIVVQERIGRVEDARLVGCESPDHLHALRGAARVRHGHATTRGDARLDTRGRAERLLQRAELVHAV